MPTATTIIPILGAQYFANPKDIAASLTEAEKEARTISLLQKVQTIAGMVMLIPEPSNHRIIHKAKPHFDHKALSFEFPNGLVEKVKIDKHLRV